MLGIAEYSDIDELSLLWQTAFNESREEAELFFKNIYYRRIKTIIYSENDHIVSMLSLLPLYIQNNGLKSGRYIYAAATHPDYRKRGFLTKCIVHAETVASAENCSFLCLVPANPGLITMYERLGFNSDITTFSYSSIDTTGYRETIVNPIDRLSLLVSIRDLFLHQMCSGAITLPDEFLEYSLQVLDYYGGYVQFYTNISSDRVSAYTIFSDSDRKNVLESTLPNCTYSKSPYGMIKHISNSTSSPVYSALMLD